jgi:7-cyano-7-deazaguanine synthase
MIVLLSAGLDSTVNLYEAKARGPVALALTFDYGQRAAAKEIENAARTCAHLKVPHKIVALPWLKEITSTSLVNTENPVPLNMDIDNDQATADTARRVWVPNRNGVFLSVAAAFAEALGVGAIVPGFNKEEAATFPDNSAEFLKAFTEGLSLSTLNRVEVKCFTTHMDKTQIVRRGRELGVNFEHVWPCYFAGDQICGECESCLRYRRALES